VTWRLQLAWVILGVLQTQPWLFQLSYLTEARLISVAALSKQVVISSAGLLEGQQL